MIDFGFGFVKLRFNRGNPLAFVVCQVTLRPLGGFVNLYAFGSKRTYPFSQFIESHGVTS